MKVCDIVGLGVLALVICVLIGPPLIEGIDAMEHADVLGLCPLAMDYIEWDSRHQPAYDKALKGWREFADYYRCNKAAGKETK